MAILNANNSMTLRDYFAIHAPEPDKKEVEEELKFRGWYSGYMKDERDKINHIYIIKSFLRYKYADTMLSERERHEI